MNPEVKKIGNKLFLASEKVELGLIQDIDSSISDASKFFQKSNEFLFNAKKPLAEAKTEYNLTISKYNDALKLAESTLNKVKELGIDVSEKQIQDKINNIKNQIKSAELALKNINSALSVL
jgi:F0F1-type ATP synthase membrane subunit b/b'